MLINFGPGTHIHKMYVHKILINFELCFYEKCFIKKQGRILRIRRQESKIALAIAKEGFRPLI